MGPGRLSLRLPFATAARPTIASRSHSDWTTEKRGRGGMKKEKGKPKTETDKERM